MAGLARALDWFDNSPQNVVASHGYQPLHRTQSMVIMHIALGVDSPTEIASADDLRANLPGDPAPTRGRY